MPATIDHNQRPPLHVNRVLLGDVREQLDTLPAECVHCVVTSPPYWALRDYGVAGQLGLEATPEEYLHNQVDVFRRVKRVLRPDGVLWVNLGDSYSGTGKSGGGAQGERSEDFFPTASTGKGTWNSALVCGVPQGSQLLMPHRFAIAMQADGWVLRSTVIWGKASPMPESVAGWRWRRCRVKVSGCPVSKRGLIGNKQADITIQNNAKWKLCPGCDKCRENGGYVLSRGKWRPTTGHEYVFQFVKSDEYFCDCRAASEPAVGGTPGNKTNKNTTAYQAGDRRFRKASGLLELGAVERRNPRTIWMLSTEPLKEKHFAAFPTSLPRRCIEASTSAAGCCPHCGNQWAPIVESERVPTRPGNDSKVGRQSQHGDSPYNEHSGMVVGNRDPQRHVAVTRVIGYRPTCRCPAHEPVPAVVLDPYAGSGTTLRVAHHLGRSYIGIELNPEYLEIINRRIALPLPKPKGHKGQKRPKKHKRQRALFE